METQEKLKHIFTFLDDKKAQDLIAFDVGKITSLADFFVICSGQSEVHNGVLKKTLHRYLKSKGVSAYNADKKDYQNNWLVLDYGDIIIHIFTPERREFYNLEGMWGDAPELTTEDVLNT